MAKAKYDIDVDFPILDLKKSDWPIGLNQIPQPPHRLYIRGLNNFQKMRHDGCKFLCVVGPRKYTDYGLSVCRKLISDLAGYPICIISGLAYGIDSVAHTAAIEAGMPTVAFPGSGLGSDTIYPNGHFELANEILKNGGCLISEFAKTFGAQPWMFPQRNRLMAGICDAVLIIEAAEKSGTTITANMAIEYDRILMSVPGSIFNHNSAATNRFIKNGAEVVTSADDILKHLGFDITEDFEKHAVYKTSHLSPTEKEVLILYRATGNISEVVKETNLTVSKINQIITKLEIDGLV